MYKSNYNYNKLNKGNRCNSSVCTNVFDQLYGYNNSYYNKFNRGFYNNFANGYKSVAKRRFKHFHEIKGIVSQTKEHIHEYETKTIKTIGKGEKHTHVYKITTSIDDGHSHKIYGKTGPANYTQYGDHVHDIDGMTTLHNGHTHFYQSYTSPEIFKQ